MKRKPEWQQHMGKDATHQDVAKKEADPASKEPKLVIDVPLPAGAASEGSSHFEEAINAFVSDLDSMANALPVVMNALASERSAEQKLLQNFARKALRVEKLADGKAHFSVKEEDASQLMKFSQAVARRDNAMHIVPRNFVVGLVSQYDAFLGRTIRALFFAVPDLLKDSEKQLTFAKLLELGTLDEAREYVVEKEVESVLRKNHTDQFTWLENKLAMKLREDLPSWAPFI